MTEWLCSETPIFKVYPNCVRKISAICLLVILLFNTGGYRFYFNQLESAASAQLTVRLDNQQYEDKDLIEIRVPVNLPYQTNWTDFERYNGEIVIEGVHYNYVKRKLYNDTLILLCIPNTEKMRLYNARETFFSLVNDLQQSSDHPASPTPLKTVKLITTEYLPLEELVALGMPPAAPASFHIPPATPIPAGYLNTDSQPPECSGLV